MLGNNMFLNKDYIYNPLMMVLSGMRHSMLLDCMFGTLDNTYTAVILQDGVVPDWIIRGAERTILKVLYPMKQKQCMLHFILD